MLKPGGVLLMIEMTAEKPFQPLELKDMKKVYGISNVFLETEWIQHLHRSGFVEAAVIFSNTVQSELQKTLQKKMTTRSIKSLTPWIPKWKNCFMNI